MIPVRVPRRVAQAFAIMFAADALYGLATAHFALAGVGLLFLAVTIAINDKLW